MAEPALGWSGRRPRESSCHACDEPLSACSPSVLRSPRAAPPTPRGSSLIPTPPSRQRTPAVSPWSPRTPTAPPPRVLPRRSSARPRRSTTSSAPRSTGGSGSSGGSGGSCDVGRAAGSDQVVVVDSSGTRATVRACSRRSDGTYATDLGPFSGYVGRTGVTSASSKREGDGHTPAGVYPLRGGFGAKGDPGPPAGLVHRRRQRLLGRRPRLGALQHPPARARRRPLGQRREPAHRPGVQLRAGHRLQRGRDAGQGQRDLPARVHRRPHRGLRLRRHVCAARHLPWERSGAVIVIS